MKCHHFGQEAEHPDAKCEYGFGLPHCNDCASQCDLCDELYCEVDGVALKELNGLVLCEECYEIEVAANRDRIDTLFNAIEIPGYWFAGRQETDEATILEYISSEQPKIFVQIKKSA